MKFSCYIFLLFLLFVGKTYAQDTPKEEKENDLVSLSDIEYEIVYDEPDSLNKLFVSFHPLYAELFATNATFGFGGQLHYYHRKKWDLYVNARKSYSTNFDIAQSAGENRSTVDNRLKNYRFFEGVFTYHYKDETQIGRAKITPYKGGTNRRIAKASVTTNLKVPAHVRKIIGIRGGAFAWGSSVNVGTIANEQNVLITSPNRQDTLSNDDNLFSNFSSEGFFIGGSYTTIRNIFITPYGYDPVTNDHIFTAYADIIFAPFMRLEAIEKNNELYELDAIRFSKFGFRMGIQGQFNRNFGWTYNIETGLRPSLQKRTFFVLLRVGATLGSKLRLKRNAYVMH